MNLFSSDVLCPANVQTMLLMDGMRLLVLAPFLEECVFRLGVQHYLIQHRVTQAKGSAWQAVLFSSLLFSLMHIGQGSIAVCAVFLPGLALAFLYQIKRSFFLCVLTHSFFNGALLLVCKW
jgi:membrane protease YdiL (CAAX protease family)